MEAVFAAPESFLPSALTALASQASWVHFFMNEVFAAPASGLPSLPTALASQDASCAKAEPAAKVAITAANKIRFMVLSPWTKKSLGIGTWNRQAIKLHAGRCDAIISATPPAAFIFQSGSAMQQRLEIGPCTLRLRARDLGRLAQPEIAMDQAFATVVPGRDVGGFERGGIGNALVAQRVVPGGTDDGGCEPRMVPGPQRRHAPIGPMRLVGEIVAAKPLHHRTRQEIAVCIGGA